MGTTVKLTPEALAFYEQHMLQRARRAEQIEQLMEEADAQEEEVFHVLSAMLGIDLGCAWEIVDEHYREFGVVLVRQLAGPPSEGDSDERDEDPEGVARG
jgi:hypothetical protein